MKLGRVPYAIYAADACHVDQEMEMDGRKHPLGIIQNDRCPQNR